MRISFSFILLVIFEITGIGLIILFLVMLLDFFKTMIAILCSKNKLKIAERIIRREIMKDKDIYNSYVITVEEVLEGKNKQKVAENIVDKIFNLW